MFGRIKMCGATTWKLLRVFTQMIYGTWKISNIPQPIVSIFGGARFTQDDFYAKKAHELAKIFVENDISVLTGGGPGIMEAASCGAVVKKDAKAKSVGISVKGLGVSVSSQAVLQCSFYTASPIL